MDEACGCEKPVLTLRELEARITELAGHLNAANSKNARSTVKAQRRIALARPRPRCHDSFSLAATQKPLSRTSAFGHAYASCHLEGAGVGSEVTRQNREH